MSRTKRSDVEKVEQHLQRSAKQDAVAQSPDAAAALIKATEEVGRLRAALEGVGLRLAVLANQSTKKTAVTLRGIASEIEEVLK
jgi:hypothetical protein